MRIRQTLGRVLLALGLWLAVKPATAEDGSTSSEKLETARQMAEDFRQDGDDSYTTHISRSESIAAGVATLTGEAVNPLVGVTARTFWVWFRAKSEQRPHLAWYYQPRVWFPLMLIFLAMIFKGTICEAAPMAKKPLDALGDMVNKAGAAVSMPIVLAMFAESFTPAAQEAMVAAADWVMPAAHAGEAAGGAGDGLFAVLGYAVSFTLGLVLYGIVWLAFNTIDVLILLCPFPAVDAVLKSFRLGVLAVLLGLAKWSPWTGVAASVVLFLICALIAGWSLRLSVFGWVYSTDMLLFRSRRLRAIGEQVAAFSNKGLYKDLPMRTYGTIRKTEDGGLVFSYRPWLVLPRREVRLPEPASAYAAGEGVLNPYVVRPRGEEDFTTLLRLPPRYQRHEAEFAAALGLSGVRDTSALRGFRAFWRSLSGREELVAP